MILQLGAGVESVAKETIKLLLALLSAPLGDVSWNRRRRAKNLTSQRSVLSTTDLLADAINTERDGVRLLPDMQLLEIRHAGESEKRRTCPPSLSRCPCA